MSETNWPEAAKAIAGDAVWAWALWLWFRWCCLEKKRAAMDGAKGEGE
jgi:hypothetical protein